MCVPLWFVILRQHVSRVQDYWEGYKLFCYSYYSHSVAHENEFRDSKLGAWFSRTLRLGFHFRFDFPPLYVFYVFAFVLGCSAMVVEVFPMFLFVQGNLYGAGTLGHAILPIIRFASLACSFFPLSKCIASGSWKRTAAIYGHSCFALT